MAHFPITLLIVDDDPIMQHSLTLIFSRHGIKVKTAGDGWLALAAMQQDRPDVLISSPHTPGMLDTKLLVFLQRRFSSAPPIMLNPPFADRQIQLAVPSFSRKGGKLGTLLNFLGVHPGLEPTPSYRETSKGAMQTTCYGHDNDGAYAIITCPGCKRIFAQSWTQQFGILQKARCEFCYKPMEYMVQHSILAAAELPIGIAIQPAQTFAIPKPPASAQSLPLGCSCGRQR